MGRPERGCIDGAVRGVRTVAIVITAKHTYIIVEAHFEIICLVLISADQPRLQVAAYYLANLINAHRRVVLCPTLNFLRGLAHLLTRSPDVFIGLHVPFYYSRGWRVHIKPFSPLTFGLAVCCALGGGGISHSYW